MKINEIWEALEKDNSTTSGLLIRRYSSSVIPNVFVSLKLPEKIRCISALVSQSVPLNISSFSNLRDIQLEVYPDPLYADKNTILFKLLNNSHKDIFSVLCEDLMLSTSAAVEDLELAKELLSRFEKWKSLFDRIAGQGLTSEEQRGLYAELYLLKKLLENRPEDQSNIISSWVGPGKDIKDFQWEHWAIEVKSSIGNNHQKVLINSERQLDASNLNHLFLYHISLEGRQKSGQTLTQIIDALFTTLSNDFISLNRFQNKLLLTGCLPQHYALYDMTGYIVRGDFFYNVKGDFPRIEEKELREGIGDLKYSIILSQCGDYLIPENQVLEILKFS
jgi:hypothetical protein